MRRWYLKSHPLAIYLAAVFKALFPHYYQQLKPAFDAGVWYKDEDPGPWLQRVVVWKMEVKTHFDRSDWAPTVSIPIGEFKGGHMDMPQLMARFL